MKAKPLVSLLFISLLVSLFFNIKPDSNHLWFVNFPNANTRPTYDSYHHVIEAQQLATGKGIKVGIIDKYFGYADNKEIYAGGENFTQDREAFEKISEHGFWMATTLKEIAPDAEIYALNARDRNRDIESDAIIAAIDWAIENDIDVLTYSAEAFRSEDRTKIDKAVRRAIDNNIVTVFIHYDLPENILPNGLFPSSPASYSRDTDVSIFHFDYNLLLLFKYEKYVKSGRKKTNNIGALPYFSNSSMSPVLAGMIAMMKESNSSLAAADYKRILVETSREIEYDGYNVRNVVDAVGAIRYLQKMNEYGSPSL
jgi:hypothetical protein